MINSTSKKFIAEVIGTFALVTGVCATILSGQTGIAPAIASGLALMVMVYVFGTVSGAHFNPAVSLAATISKRMQPSEMVTYWIAQLVGAFLAVTFAQSLFTAASPTAIVSVASGSISSMTAITAEAVATFFLALTVLAVSSSQSTSRAANGLAIGSCLIIGGYIIGSLTGASLNPARSIAPAVLTGDFASLGTFIIGPAIGGIVAGLIGNLFFTAEGSLTGTGSGYNSNTNQQGRRAA